LTRAWRRRDSADEKEAEAVGFAVIFQAGKRKRRDDI